MILCVNLLWPSKIICSLILIQNVFNGWVLGTKLVKKTCFWKIWVEFMCFLKTFNLILMHFIHEILCFEEFLHKIALFFKKFSFPDFRLIEDVSRPIKIVIKIFVWICLARSVLDWSNLFFDRSKLNYDQSKFGQWAIWENHVPHGFLFLIDIIMFLMH